MILKRANVNGPGEFIINEMTVLISQLYNSTATISRLQNDIILRNVEKKTS